MSTLRTAAQQALEYLEAPPEKLWPAGTQDRIITALSVSLAEPERTLTDEVIAELWYKNGTHHHHFARAIERWLKQQ